MAFPLHAKYRMTCGVFVATCIAVYMLEIIWQVEFLWNFFILHSHQAAPESAP